MNNKIDIFEGLNGPQREAVENYNGPTLIIAGAGSGKTRTLTCRIANMIESGVKPWNILALTFTNKAAREMKERIKTTVPPERLRGLWMGTFHGIFRRLIAENAERLGFPLDYTIYDSADSQNLIKQIVKQMELPDDLYKPRMIASRISLAKNNLMLPDVYAQRDILIEEDRQMKMPKLFEIYKKYFLRCKAAGAMDFDDILLYMNILLRDFPEVATEYGERFKYILVDEYQDTNSAQYLILKRLAAGHSNICVVGDDSQSIYSFRGAKIENILRFQKDYTGVRLIKLEQNYRSTSNIVNAANSLIEHNKRKLKKHLFSAAGEGDKIRVISCFNDREEAAEVVRSIKMIMDTDGSQPEHFAILYRTNSQSRIFEDALRQRSIPYRIYGGQSFYQRAEIKDLLAYLKLAVNRRDDLALQRIINSPARGIGDTSLKKITEAAANMGLSIWEYINSRPVQELGIRGTAVKGIEQFIGIYDGVTKLINSANAYEVAEYMARRSGILPTLKASQLLEDVSRLDNIEELLNSIKEYVSNAEEIVDENGDAINSIAITGWLSEVALLTDQDEADDETSRVTMLTVHASKGLEFRHIFIVGIEENLFPGARATTDEDIEEERRIFYVALTRAEKSASLSFALSRFRYGDIVDCSPSRFLSEIDTKYLDGDVEAAVPKAFLQTKFDEPEFARHKTAEPKNVREKFEKREKPQNNLRTIEKLQRNTTPPGMKPVAAARPDERFKPVENVGQITVGVNVEHQRFGQGVVNAIDQAGSDVRVTVEFRTGGTKTLLLKFAKLRILEK